MKDSIILNCTSSTYLDKKSPMLNYNFQDRLLVGKINIGIEDNYEFVTLLNFKNVDKVKKDFSKAVLYLYVENIGINEYSNISLYRNITNSNLKTLNWYNMPEVKGKYIDIALSDNIMKGYIEVDVTSLLTEWENTNSILSFTIVSNVDNNSAFIRFSSVHSDHPPYIEILYEDKSSRNIHMIKEDIDKKLSVLTKYVNKLHEDANKDLLQESIKFNDGFLKLLQKVDGLEGNTITKIEERVKNLEENDSIVKLNEIIDSLNEQINSIKNSDIKDTNENISKIYEEINTKLSQQSSKLQEELDKLYQKIKEPEEDNTINEIEKRVKDLEENDSIIKLNEIIDSLNDQIDSIKNSDIKDANENISKIYEEINTKLSQQNSKLQEELCKLYQRLDGLEDNSTISKIEEKVKYLENNSSIKKISVLEENIKTKFYTEIVGINEAVCNMSEKLKILEEDDSIIKIEERIKELEEDNRSIEISEKIDVINKKIDSDNTSLMKNTSEKISMLEESIKTKFYNEIACINESLCNISHKIKKIEEDDSITEVLEWIKKSEDDNSILDIKEKIKKMNEYIEDVKKGNIEYFDKSIAELDEKLTSKYCIESLGINDLVFTISEKLKRLEEDDSILKLNEKLNKINEKINYIENKVSDLIIEKLE